jgi:hypothetical protein
MVAHRLSTVLESDLILVVNHGRIIERGRHHELLARSGLYRQLWDAQQGLRRRDAAAALSADDLSEMTRAIADAAESGRPLHGPALAELARSMASARNGGGAGSSPEWAVVQAVWALLKDGSTDRLNLLAQAPGAHAQAALAERVLSDLGMPPTWRESMAAPVRKAS